MEGETRSKNLMIFGGKWLVLIDIDVAVHACLHYILDEIFYKLNETLT